MASSDAHYPLLDLLGSTLTNHRGEQIATSSLKGKTVGLYFSASWCPPCRRFTPLLAETYHNLSTSQPGTFEVIYISSDRDVASFTEYYGKMPWLALSFSEQDRKEQIFKKLGIKSIPSLKIYNGLGVLTQADGVQQVIEDPDGFPWPTDE